MVLNSKLPKGTRQKVTAKRSEGKCLCCAKPAAKGRRGLCITCYGRFRAALETLAPEDRLPHEARLVRQGKLLKGRPGQKVIDNPFMPKRSAS